MDLTREALYKIYYAVPANLRTYAKWRMSEATYEALVEAYAPKDPDDVSPAEPGRPGKRRQRVARVGEPDRGSR